MYKKLAAMVLMVLLVIGCTTTGVGAAAPGWEQKVNALQLHPVDPADITGNAADYLLGEYNRFASLVQPGMTNAEILRAVYEHVTLHYRDYSEVNMPGAFQCTDYASELGAALYYMGFDVRYMQGECTTKNGGWTGHAWTGVRVGDEILYFDANIPAEHGGNLDAYFAMPENSAFYRNAEAYVIYMSPDLNRRTSRKEGEQIAADWWVY